VRVQGDSGAEKEPATDVVVVDDHRAFSELLALALTGEPDLRCVGTAATVAEGLALVDRLRPDVVVMDVQVGADDGVAATALLTGRYPELRVVVLTAHADRATLDRATAADACAVLPKDGSLTEILGALRTARRGGLVVHPRLLRRIVTTSQPGSAPCTPTLTGREQEVLQLLADGLDARAAAKQLGISLHTCRGYIKSLLVKLEAHSQLQAVAIATRNGLVRVRATR
jgi:DNA-binding NarL/FixJ family response regulator